MIPYNDFKIKFSDCYNKFLEFEKHNAIQKVDETLEVLFWYLITEKNNLSDVKFFNIEQIKLLNKNYNLLGDKSIKYSHVDIIKRFIMFLEDENIIEKHDDFVAWEGKFAFF